MTTIPTHSAPVMNQQVRGLGPQAAAQPPLPNNSSVDPLKLLNKYKWLLAGSAVVGAVLGTGAHFILARVNPKWRPIALFQVLPPQENAANANVGGTNTTEMDRFMQTQVRVMTSDAVINKVVEDKQIEKKAEDWSSQFMETNKNDGQKRFNSIDAAKEMRDMVSARVIPQTNLIELAVTDKRRLDATEILTLIRTKYTIINKEQSLSLSDDRVESLRKMVTRTDAEIKALTNNRESMINTMGMDSLESALSSTKAKKTDTDQELLKVDQNIKGAQKSLEQMKEQQKAGGFPNDLIARIEKDPAVAEVQSLISRMETEQQAMQIKGMPKTHREYMELDARLEGAKLNLDRVKTERLRKTFDGDLDGLEKAIAQLEAQKASLTKDSAEHERRLTDLTRTDSQLKDIASQIQSLLDNRAKTSAFIQDLLGQQQQGSFGRVVLLQPERAPTEMSFPKLKIMIPAGLIICVGLVGGVMLLREIVDQRVKGPSDITIIPRTKLLGWVPDAAEDPAGQGTTETAFRDRPKGIVAESFRQIRGSMSKRLTAGDHKTVLVTAGMPGSGASSTACNLAFAFASTDKRVLLIDANFRRPALHRVMGLKDGPGLADILTRNAELGDVVQATSTPNLDLLSVGSKEHRISERLATESMGELLTKVRMMYDIILVDVAPAIVAGDGVALAHRCDASILVVRAMSEKRGMIARLKNDLSDGRSEFLGVIVNAVRAASGGYMKGNIRAAHEYQQS